MFSKSESKDCLLANVLSPVIFSRNAKIPDKLGHKIPPFYLQEYSTLKCY